MSKISINPGVIKNRIVEKVSKWPLEKKITVLASFLMVISLFFSWYNDTDVFRTGESYNGLNGPLYLAGYSILMLGILSIFTSFNKFAIPGIGKSEKSRGKAQLICGFLALYMLILINTAYFHPKFGLNLLSKKSEFGAMLELFATMLLCIGGYLLYRKGHIAELDGDVAMENEVTESATVSSAPAQTINEENTVAVQNYQRSQGGLEVEKQGTYKIEVAPEKASVERVKTYETIKMLMEKDTKSAEQRRKDREKVQLNNVFSKNSGIEFDKKAAGVAQNTAVRPAVATPKTGNPEDLLRNAFKRQSS